MKVRIKKFQFNFIMIIGMTSLLHLIFGCNKDLASKKELSLINIEEPSKYRSVPFEFLDMKDVSIINGFRNCLYKNYLLIHEWTPFQKLTIIDINNGKIINEFGSEDNDPNSFSQDLTCSCQFFEEKNSIYVIAKDSKRGLFKLNILEKKEAFFLDDQKVEYPNDVYAQHFYLATNSKVDENSSLVAYYPDEHGVIRYSPESEITEIKKLPAKIKRQNLEKLISANIYGSETSFDHRSNTIAVGYYYFNDIDIIDSDDNKITSIRIGNSKNRLPFLDKEGSVSDKNIFYTGFIDQTKDKIYINYFNKPYSEVDTQEETRILIIDKKNFDIEGVVIKEKIAGFRVSEDNKSIYGLVNDETYSKNIIKIEL